MQRDRDHWRHQPYLPSIYFPSHFLKYILVSFLLFSFPLNFFSIPFPSFSLLPFFFLLPPSFLPNAIPFCPIASFPDLRLCFFLCTFFLHTVPPLFSPSFLPSSPCSRRLVSEELTTNLEPLMPFLITTLSDPDKFICSHNTNTKTQTGVRGANTSRLVSHASSLAPFLFPSCPPRTSTSILPTFLASSLLSLTLIIFLYCSFGHFPSSSILLLSPTSFHLIPYSVLFFHLPSVLLFTSSHVLHHQMNIYTSLKLVLFFLIPCSVTTTAIKMFH